MWGVEVYLLWWALPGFLLMRDQLSDVSSCWYFSICFRPLLNSQTFPPVLRLMSPSNLMESLAVFAEYQTWREGGRERIGKLRFEVQLFCSPARCRTLSKFRTHRWVLDRGMIGTLTDARWISFSIPFLLSDPLNYTVLFAPFRQVRNLKDGRGRWTEGCWTSVDGLQYELYLQETIKLERYRGSNPKTKHVQRELSPARLLLGAFDCWEIVCQL